MTASAVPLIGSGQPAPAIEGVFVYDRPAPAEWMRRLREISPVSEVTSFLDIIWEPGDPWMPAQRYMLYEVYHPKLVSSELLSELRGPHPRKEGHICTSVPVCDWAVRPPDNYRPCLCRHKLEAWRGGMSAVGLTEWKYFQRTGYVAKDPFWCIQGDNGGHRLGYSSLERELLENEGYPTDVPAPGVLPYAPFDERVVRGIARFNRLWKFRNDIEAYKKATSPEGYAKHQSELERELRSQLVAQLRSEMESLRDLVLREEITSNPSADLIDFERLDELSEKEFIETGNVLHQSKVWTAKD